MKVILRDDVVNVGRQGEIKEVSPGFARNYLVPKRFAMEANDKNMRIWEREKEKLAKVREAQINDAKVLAEKMLKESLTISVKVGDNGKLFGSVTVSDIAEGLKEKGFTVGKHAILLADSIKEVGAFSVDIRLHPEVVSQIKVWVVEEKKDASAKGEAEDHDKEK